MNQPDHTFKISLLAMENAGKNTLVKKYFKDRVFDFDTMIIHGVTFATKDLELYEKGIRSSIWIFSAEERFRKLFRDYINGSNGIILMYDITNVNSLDWLSERCEEIKNSLDYNVPMLLVGNKLDLEENREVSKEQVETFKEKHDISFSMEVSLKSGENIEKMFMNITRLALNKLNPEIIPNSIF